MKKVMFFFLITFYGVLVLADGALTYINTPDLSMEANPLVSVLGLGWAALAIANILAFALVYGLAYYSFFKYETICTGQTSFTSYCSQVLYNRPDRFWSGIVIKNWKPFLASMGFGLICGMIIARAILVMQWLLVTFDINWPEYNYFRATYCLGRVDVIVGSLTILVFMLIWFYLEYKKQLHTEDP